jgi:hypothetical protein
MKIELTEEQYRRLVELVFLGSWFANSIETGEGINEDFEEMEQVILSYSKQLNMEDLITYDEEFEEYFPTTEFEDIVDPYIKKYDNEVFWEGLLNRLAKRDLLREIGPVNRMSDDHLKRLFEIEEKYDIEFEKNGLKNLEVKSWVNSESKKEKK